MPRTVEIHEIFWSRRLVIGALTLVDERRDAVIPRAALVHHRGVDTGERLAPDEWRRVRRKREHRLHPRILPAPPRASQPHHRVAAERMPTQAQPAPVNR